MGQKDRKVELLPEFEEQGQSAELTVGGFAKVGNVEFLMRKIHHQNREDGLINALISILAKTDIFHLSSGLLPYWKNISASD